MENALLSLAVHGKTVHSGRRHALCIHRFVHGHVQDVVGGVALAEQQEVVGPRVHRRERRTGVPFVVLVLGVHILRAGSDADAAELAVQMIVDAIPTGAVGGRGDHDVDVAAEVYDVRREARVGLHAVRVTRSAPGGTVCSTRTPSGPASVASPMTTRRADSARSSAVSTGGGLACWPPASRRRVCTIRSSRSIRPGAASASWATARTRSSRPPSTATAAAVTCVSRSA